jgi:hypothetical protein
MVGPGNFTAIVDIAPGKLNPLRELLNRIGDNIPGNGIIDFAGIPNVYFMRWVILDASTDIHDHAIAATLAFGADFDVTTTDFLHGLVKAALAGLDQIYQHCEGFPGANNPAELITYLQRNSVKTSTYYAGYRGRSVAQIRDESELRRSVQNFLGQNYQTLKSAKPETVLKQIKGLLFGADTDKFAWAESPYVPYLGMPIDAVTVSIGAVAIAYCYFCVRSPVPVLYKLIPFYIIAALLVTLLFKEATDKQWTGTPDPKLVDELLEDEDRTLIVQNQLTHIVNIKPGPFRLASLRFVLFAINWLAANKFFTGNLGGIPSIHFARWMIIDQGRRLLFFSNFDGSWENYLGDFIDRAHQGLTGVWSNTDGFPKTHFLINDGATNEELFKNWARYHQIPTQVWYTSNPQLTVQNINNNTAIRSGLLDTTAAEADAWVRLL